jgi:hypothetical protein
VLHPNSIILKAIRIIIFLRMEIPPLRRLLFDYPLKPDEKQWGGTLYFERKKGQNEEIKKQRAKGKNQKSPSGEAGLGHKYRVNDNFFVEKLVVE